MDDLLRRARALRALVEIAKSEPMNMTRFMVATDYVWESADLLLRDLEADGLITVKERQEGSIRSKEIALTEEGRRVATHGAAIDAEHAKAKERKAREKMRV